MTQRPETKRVVTVVIAIECRVEGDASLRDIGLDVLAEPSATGIVMECGTRVFPHAFGLIQTTEQALGEARGQGRANVAT